MRYSPDQKAKAKALLIEASAKALRKNGFNGIGIDGLAASAGVTSGAFYSNFSGKEDILGKVIDACLGKSLFDQEVKSALLKSEDVIAWIDMYLSDAHRDAPDAGCVMPTLSADVARAGPVVRDAYKEKMKALIGKIAKTLDGTPKEKESAAWSLVALMVGAVMISRALPDGKESRAALQSALQTAHSLVDKRF